MCMRPLFALLFMHLTVSINPAVAGEWFNELSKDPLAIANKQEVSPAYSLARRSINGAFRLHVATYGGARLHEHRLPSAGPELMRYMRDHTKIEAHIGDPALRFSDPTLFNVPVVYMTGSDGIFTLSDADKECLGRYLRSGGFLFAEDIRQSAARTLLPSEGAGVKGTPFDTQFKALMKDPLVLGKKGEQWQKVPQGHPLFHSFWDFGDGPPLGGALGGNVFDLEMLEERGRVLVVFSDLNLSWYWGDLQVNGRERALQFGVNLMVYALTQPSTMINATQYTR